MNHLLYFILPCIALSTRVLERQKESDTPFRIVFGSCFNLFDSRSDIFKSITEYDPQIFIWLGDYAYTDVMPIPLHFNPGSQDYTYERFNLTLNDPYYSVFRKGKRIILGTMDDHDYGLNNAGVDNPVKDFNKRLFLEAMEEPADSVRWQEGRGLFEDYVITHKEKKIHIVLLDGRYYMEPDRKKNAAFLGEEQWRWLEGIFATTQSDLYLIGSGVQFLQNYRWETEGWHRHEKKRFLDLVQKYRKNNLIFLSGDIHFLQFYRSICPLGGSAGYYLYEATSSGLSHVATDYIPFADHFTTFKSSRSYPISKLESLLNFGTIQLNPDDSRVKFEFRGIDNNVIQSIEIDLDDLKYDEHTAFQDEIFDCSPLNVEYKQTPIILSWVFHLFKEQVPAALAYFTVLLFVGSTLLSILGYPVYRLLFLVLRQTHSRLEVHPFK